MASALRLQPLLRARVASLGESGAAWVAALPGLIADLERAWGVTLGRSLPGGSAGYVAPALTPEGRRMVVKIAVPDGGGEPPLADEARLLRAAGGVGYVTVHAVDLARGAMLLESLGDPLERRRMPVGKKLDILTDALAVAWSVPLDAVPAVEPGQDKATTLGRLVRQLDAELDHPCPPDVIAQALAFADHLAATTADQPQVVVHGDPHPSNLLAVDPPRPGATSGWAFVDPDGFRCEPAYDLGVVLRDWSGELSGEDARVLATGYRDRLAARSGLDPERIWAWGFLERVSTGLYVWDFGAPRVARPFFTSAARLR